jgi:hypothetical protein
MKSKKEEILSQPEILRVTPVGAKLSVITFLLALISIYLYSQLFYSAVQAIPKKSMSQTQYYALIAAVLIIGTGIAILTVYALITKKKQPLIFTTIGMVGIGKYAINYSELDCYGWQKCNDFVASGQLSGRLQTTIRIYPKSKSWLQPTYIDRFGNSIFGNFGYFFDDTQMKSANEILTRYGVSLISDSES